MVTERYGEAKKVTLIGAFVNAMLGGIKLVGGIVCHSHALTADGFHSFSDLITDAMVLFASKYGSQDADEDHPYGHQRFETAGTLLLALLLILAGLGIAWHGIYELLDKNYEIPNGWAFPLIILSIIANEILFHYTQFIGKKIKSALILANAWHHRSDAASSVVVAIGLLGSFVGYPYLDTVAAIIVGIMIIKMGLDYGWDSVKELVDTAVRPEDLKEINAIIRGVDGVKKIHQLRTRLMGGDILVDVHILVSPFISVSEGHFIAQHVHHALLDEFDNIQDVIVHVDPEDDEENCPSMHLPKRQSLEQQLLLSWKEQFPFIKYWTLHYLEGDLRIDLINQDPGNDMDQLTQRIAYDLQNASFIKQVYLLREDKIIENAC